MEDIYQDQREMCVLYGAGYMAVSDDLIIGVADSVRSGVSPIHGLRYMYKDSMAGWFLWTGPWEEREDFFKPMHVRHIRDEFPDLIKYFGLAPGWRFLWSPKADEVWYDHTLLKEEKEDSLRRR